MMSQPNNHLLLHPNGTAIDRRHHARWIDRTVRFASDRRVQAWASIMIAAASMLAYALIPQLQAEIQHGWSVLSSGDQQEIGDYLRSFGIWGPVISLGLMIGQAIVAPIPGSLVVFANGIAFGTFWGTVLSVVGQTLAAIVCFGIARIVGRGPVEALVGRFGLQSLDRGFGRWGAYSILLLRLVPGAAFDGVSYGAGLLDIRFRTFVLATIVGIIPQSLFYTWMIRHYPGVMWTITIVSLALFVAVAVGGTVLGLVRRRRNTRSLTG